MSEDIDIERLKKATEDLSEFFDSVQIFATRYDPDDDGGGTTSATWGSGNWFARRGQIGEWLLKQDERSKGEVRKEEE